jgi:hypothetical protein
MDTDVMLKMFRGGFMEGQLNKLLSNKDIMQFVDEDPEMAKVRFGLAHKMADVVLRRVVLAVLVMMQVIRQNYDFPNLFKPNQDVEKLIKRRFA